MGATASVSVPLTLVNLPGVKVAYAMEYAPFVAGHVGNAKNVESSGGLVFIPSTDGSSALIPRQRISSGRLWYAYKRCPETASDITE